MAKFLSETGLATVWGRIDSLFLRKAGGDVTGTLNLYSASGDSPALVFRRGTLTDTLDDWRVFNTAGNLKFQRTSGSTTNWQDYVVFTPTAGTVTINGNTVLHSGNYNSSTYADTVPTQNSTKFVTSGGIYSVIEGLGNLIEASESGLDGRLTTLEGSVVTGSGLTADKIVLGNGERTVKTSSKGIATSVSSSSDDTTVPTSKAVWDAFGSVASALKYKGTVASNSALPATHAVGDVWVVSTAGTFVGKACEVGDYIVCKTAGTSADNAHWDVLNGENQVENKSASLATAGNSVTIATVDGTNITVKTPSGWNGVSKTGTVTSVGMTVPTGLSISGSPITASGTLALTLTSGYSIPTTAKQTNWDTAYGWGNHSGLYLPLSGGTVTGTLDVKRTTSEALGIDTNLKIGTAKRNINIDFSSGSGTGINDGNSGGLTFCNGSSAYGGIYAQTSGSYGLKLHFATTNSFADGAYTRMLIDHSGNVGIGTLSPSQKLHVAGTIYSSVATGTAPFKVDSTTAVTNLNADLLDGKHASDFATSGHTHTTSLATSTGTSALSLAYGTKYSLTAGGTSYIFTTPSLGTSATTAAAGNHTHTFASLTSKPTTLSGYGITDAASSSHTHTLSIAADSGTNALTLAAGTKYKLTAGGSTFIFTMPAEDTVSVTNSAATIGTSLTTIATINGTNITAKIGSYVALSGDQTISGNKGFSGSIYGDLQGLQYWGIDNDGSAFFDSLSVGGSQIDFSSFALKAGGTDYNFRVDSLIVSDGGTLDGTTYNGKPVLRFAYSYTDESSMTPTIVSETKYLAYKDEIPTDYVNLSGAQTVTGTKTFSGGITMSGANILPSADDANSIGSSTYRFNAAYVRNIYTSYLEMIDGTSKTSRGSLSMGDGYAQISLVGTNAANYMLYSTNGFFKQGGGVPLGRSDHRWSNVYSVGGDFSAQMTASGGIVTGDDIRPSTNLGASLGNGDYRFSGLSVNTISSSAYYFRDSSWSSIAHYAGGFDDGIGYMCIYLDADPSNQNPPQNPHYYFFGSGSFQGRGGTKNLGSSGVPWGDVYIANNKAIKSPDTGGTIRDLLKLANNDWLYIGNSGITSVQLNATGYIKMYWDSGDAYASFGAGANAYFPNLLPNGTSGTKNLGSSSVRWNNIYGVNGNFSGTLEVNGNSVLDESMALTSAEIDSILASV